MPRLTASGLDATIDGVEREKREENATRRLLKRAQAHAGELEKKVDLLTALDAVSVSPAPWAQPGASREHHGIANLLLSDLHLDEVVDVAEMREKNAFNRAIAHKRLAQVGANTVKMARDYISGVKFDGLTVWVNGDLVTGNIHEELVQTNDAADVIDTIDHWVDPLCSLLCQQADHFERVHITASGGGNHGRTQKRPPAKRAVRSNFDWLLMRIIWRELRTDDRFTWNISDALDVRETQYEHRYFMVHGDDFQGGDQIAGAVRPVMMGDYRTLTMEIVDGEPYDTLLVGHFHQYTTLPRAIINGCFPSGAKVMTTSGYTAIEQVAAGDQVMSRDGSEQKVTHTFAKQADRLIGLKVAGLPEVVEATPNHLVWAAKRASRLQDVPPSRRSHISDPHGPVQWVPIDFLSPGDLVHVPFPHGNARPVDIETAWAYGLYLAEGNALLDGGSNKRHHRVNLTMHARETQIVERWASWFNDTFGVTPHIGHRKGRNTTDLYVSAGRDTSAWFRETFGHGAGEKHLPDGALWWADDLKAALVDGWVTGDGHSAPQDDCRPTVSATTISPRLAWGIFHLAPATGSWPALAKLRAGGPRKNDSYTVHFNTGQNVVLIDGEAFYPVVERFERCGTFAVFDLEVSGEHTYCVGGIGVHNSLKGYDEFAKRKKFRPEPPKQAFWVTTPENGPSFHLPILSLDRDAEGW